MARRILILILLSPVGALCVHEIAPGFREAVSRDAPSFSEADAQDDGYSWGECPPVEPEPRGGYLIGAISRDDLPHETHAVRRALKASRQQGPGPVLGLLSDCLILSRPPPGAPAAIDGTPGPIAANRTTTTRRTIP